MIGNLSVFAIVPAYREGALIQSTIKSIPSSIDTIIVVDDGSPDHTSDQVRRLADPRTRLIIHEENRGVGAAIYSGYDAALALGADILVVMAGDNQMDGADLDRVLAPLVHGAASYVKGNRHIHPRVKDMPWARRWGSRLLARATSWAMGKRVGDSQCGYTALSRSAALSLDFSAMWPRYGYPNDMLITLGRRGFTICEVPVRPVYAQEKSGLRAWHLVTILWVIARSWRRERRTKTSARENYSKEQLMG